MDKLRWLLEARFARASAIGARTLTADWSVSMGGLIGALIGFQTPPAPCHAGHCVLTFCLAAVELSAFSSDRLGGVLVVSLKHLPVWLKYPAGLLHRLHQNPAVSKVSPRRLCSVSGMCIQRLF